MIHHREQFVTPGTIADELGVSVNKVLTWIRAGDLPAIDVSSDGAKRPRWRVSRSAVEQFFAARTNRARAVVSSHRRQSRTPDEVIQFF